MPKNNREFNHEALIGQRFGRLLGVQVDEQRDRHGNVYLICRCDCGTVKSIRKFCLTAKDRHTRSCGCLAKEVKRYHNWKGCGDISGQHMLVFKKNAKNRNIPFEVTKEYLWSLYIEQNKICALTGTPIDFGKSNRDGRTASLDRIDSTKGYIEGNVQWVHKTVNVMKSYMSEDVFLDWCKKIVVHNSLLDPKFK